MQRGNTQGSYSSDRAEKTLDSSGSALPNVHMHYGQHTFNHSRPYRGTLDDEEEEDDRAYRGPARGMTPEAYYEDIYGQYAQMGQDDQPGNKVPLPYAEYHSDPHSRRIDMIRQYSTPKKQELDRNRSTSDRTEKTSRSSRFGSLWGKKSISDRRPSTRHQRGAGSSTLPLSSPAAQKFGWFPRSWPTRLFLLVTLAEAAADVSIEAVLLSRFRQSQGSFSVSGGNLSALPVFLVVFGMAHLYQCFLAVDAIVNRNTILVFGLVAFNLAFLVYALIQIEEIRGVLGDGVIPGTSQSVPVQVLTGAIPVIIGIASAIFVVLAYFLWKEFGWQIYKTIGADRRLKRAHMHFQIFVCFLKFDFFTFIAYNLQLVLVVLSKSTAEFWVTAFAAPVSLFLLIFAWYSVRKEWKWGAIVFMCGLWGGAGYFAYKLFRIWQQRLGPYRDVYKSLTVFSVLALALLLATFIITIRCMLNFDIGLKAAMARSQEERKAQKDQDAAGPVISAPFQYELDSPYTPQTANAFARNNDFGGMAYSDSFGAGPHGLPSSASQQGLLSPIKSPATLLPLRNPSISALDRQNSGHRLSLD